MAHTGVMVALYPDRRNLGRLSRVAASLPNAQSADDMHVTICYLGEREALEPYKALIFAALMDVAEHAPVPLPLELRLRGAGRFDHVNDDGTQAIYAAIQSPDLHTLRDAIKASLASVGAEADQTFPTFTPHITLGYIPSYLPTPAVHVPPMTIPAGTLYLCWGSEKIALPMRAAKRRAVALEAKAVAAMPSAALAHGPGGLFSNPALEGGGWRKRRTKAEEYAYEALEQELTPATPEGMARERARLMKALTPDEFAMAEALGLVPRAKAQRTFGGTKRADLPPSAFIDPRRRSFPVMTAQDVRDAVSSWGRYRGPLSFAEFKRRLIRRARAIGAGAALPQAWAEGNDTATRGKSLSSPLRGSQGQVAFKPFRSTAQQRWAFANRMPWAERWADETDFGGLPARVARRKSKSARRRLMRLKASAESTGSGGATGSGYGARAGQVIRGRLMRGADGKFTADGAAAPSTPARPPTRRKPKKARGGKAPKLTPEQRRAQRAAERAAELAANLAAVGEAFMQADAPLSKGGLEALAKFAAGEALDAEMAQQLADLGVVTLGEDGTPRLSPDGRKVVNAAKRGDIRAAVDAAFAAGEKVGIGAAGELLPGWERGENGKPIRTEEPAGEPGKDGDPVGAIGDALRKGGDEKEPKKAGGGGSGGGSNDPDKPPTAGAGRSALRGAGPSQGPAAGGGASSSGRMAGGGGKPRAAAPKEGEPKETTEERQARRSAERQAELDARRERAALDKAAKIADAIGKAGIEPDAFFALRDWSEGGMPGPGQFPAVVQLASLGLLNDRLEVSNEGRRALSALERGDVRQYFAAVQAGQRRLEREAERAERDARRSVEEAKAYKHGKHNQATHGRKGRAGRAGASAYQAARASGAGHSEARAAGRQATTAERAAERAERAASRTSRLQTQAERARRAAASDQVTPAQRAKLLDKADRLEARARGETVGPRAKPAKADGDPTRAYGADPNQSYQLQHRVVDMADLKASNLANGAINPAYDPALQPRDRSRAASQAQIDQVARNLNPDVLVTDFHRIDAGSPIIDANGNVLSGNGRTLALQRAADMNPAQYAAYKARLKDEAERLGIDPKSIDGMRNPVLVRELKGDADPVAFAREANSSGTLRMSPLEQAKVDAGLVSDRSLLKLNVRDGQDIDKALRDPSNKTFINDFLATVPDNERANLLTRNGELNQMGLYRAKAALYTKAFPGEAGSRLAESMLESLDPDVKTIQNGISASLPNISRVTALMRNGDRDSSLDLSEDFAKTIDVYARIKDNPALTANTPANQLVSKYLGQSQMFDRELTPDQEVLLRHIDTISRRPSAVRDMFNDWARIVENQPPPGQSSLFGGGGLSRQELIDALIRGDTGGSSQAGMFDG
jgi:2'-5' RNA ligase